jgi:hypothetical protein
MLVSSIGAAISATAAAVAAFAAWYVALGKH